MKKLFRNRKHPLPEAKGPYHEDDNRVVDGLGLTIAAINTTKDLVPIDLAKGILGTIANILTIAQSVVTNKSDFLAIAERCDDIKTILEGATEDDLQGSFAHALSQLNISVNRINSKLASKQEQNLWKRLLFVTVDRNDIVAWEKDLDNAIRLFSLEAMVGVGREVKQLGSGVRGSSMGTYALRHRPMVPPPRPSMFYGRDDLVAELTNLIINDQHIALIGTGGMGKSSLAKAILNEPLVIQKFIERRFFVTYDGLDPSTITFETFTTRLTGDLGLEITGADPMRQISTFLRSTPALIVLDNAETFEEASGSLALEQIPPAIASIADIPGVTLILTSRSRRNAPNIRWITKDIPPLDVSSALDAFFGIYSQASRNICEQEITKLLAELEFHPLSINLLATAAQQNSWSTVILLKRWRDQPSSVLNHGDGKLESLSATMQLSLSSPSIQKLGKSGRRALAVIAYLPQGLNDDLAEDLLPSLEDISTICDVLCRQSLVSRHGTFIKMLAPIRHYVQNSSQEELISACLGDMRAFYYRTVQSCSEERDSHADIIVSDHLNIEHVIGFDLSQIPKGTIETCGICGQFLMCLQRHLPRPTALAPAIFNIPDNPSTCAPKAECLKYLGNLYWSLSQLTEASRTYEIAEALYLTSGVHDSVAYCAISRAIWYTFKGHHTQAQEVMEDFQRSHSWTHLSQTRKANVWFRLDEARTYTFTSPADQLFLRSMEDREWGLWSKIFHWRARLYYGEDILQVETHLEALLPQCTGTGSMSEALQGLAEIAFLQGRLSEAMDILQKMADIVEGKDQENFIWSITRKATIAALLGNYDLARELILKAKPVESITLQRTHAFLHRSYGSAQVELIAGECDKAEYHLNATVEACDMQGNLYAKARSMRGLGEVAFARGNFTLAMQHFAETRSLCVKMGVPTRKLYGCYPLYTLPERFEGWMSFLDGRSPFANAI